MGRTKHVHSDGGFADLEHPQQWNWLQTPGAWRVHVGRLSAGHGSKLTNKITDDQLLRRRASGACLNLLPGLAVAAGVYNSLHREASHAGQSSAISPWQACRRRNSCPP